jgi:hypothetical protein
MAEITPKESVVNPTNTRATYLSAVYAGMKAGDVGLPPQGDTATCQSSSVQVAGQFGSGGLVAIEGSNDGENWSALRDPTSTTIALRSPSIRAVLESTVQIRPHVTGGDDTTNHTVTMMFRRA